MDLDKDKLLAASLLARIRSEFKRGELPLLSPNVTESERSLLHNALRARDPGVLLLKQQPGLQLCKVLTNTRSTSSPRTRRPGKGKRKGPYRRDVGHNTLGTPRTLLPDELDIEMPYAVQATMTNPGIAYASLRFISNGLYDPDPLLGGTSFTGLSQWATLYNLYRVISYHWDVEICNREAFPMFVDFYNSNTDPSASVGISGMSYSLNPWGKRESLGPLGGGRDAIRVKGFVDLAKMFGSEMVETSPLLVGNLTASNPPETFFFGFNTRSIVVQTSAGVYYTLTLRARVRLFDRVLIL